MVEASSRKCIYFNSGYCKFTRQENGCRYLHPAETCKVIKCRDKECPFRHPKNCRHGERCRYQTKCMYHHRSLRSYTNNTDEKTKKLEQEITVLKAEVSKLKAENLFKVQALARVHLLEMEDLKQKNNTFMKGYLKEVRVLKTHNNKLQTALEYKESFNPPLAFNDKLREPVEAPMPSGYKEQEGRSMTAGSRLCLPRPTEPASQ